LDIIERWKTLDSHARTAIATGFLKKTGQQIPAAESGGRLEQALHARLQQIAGLSAP